jgi:6-phosphogluconate dehydrogenase
MSHTLGFIGLGRMGANMVTHLLEQGIDVVVYNRTKEKTDTFIKDNPKARGSSSLEEFIQALPTPRIIWLMVPNGAPVDEMINGLLAAGIQKGDYVIDGGNTYYKDTVRRSGDLASKGIHYIDCGTSGGLEGARTGACLMIGGVKENVEELRWLWEAGATKNGWSYFGPSGAGHFVKMVHNGVEYGMNQALGEGFEILANGPYKIDFAKVAHNWSHGSVVRSWLVELLAKAFDADPTLSSYSGKVGGGETGAWTTEAAQEFKVDAGVIVESIEARKKSQQKPTFAGKVVSALRAGYGGHKEPK